MKRAAGRRLEKPLHGKPPPLENPLFAENPRLAICAPAVGPLLLEEPLLGESPPMGRSHTL